MTPGRKTLFIVCGEPSGETYAVRVARAFRKRFPMVPMEGIGSVRLANEGVRLLLDYEGISVVGLTEVARHLPAIARAVELGLGATGPGEIELVTGDAESRAYAARVERILAEG